jgi:predicted acylesterase/phospholipase RssA
MPPKKVRQKRESGLKIALVLGGGAIKAGNYHLGTLLALSKHGIEVQGGIKSTHRVPILHPITHVVGASAGAFVGAVASSGLPVESIIRLLGGQNYSIPPFHAKDLLFVKEPKTPHVTSQEQVSWPTLATRMFQKLFEKKSQLQGLFSSLGVAAYLKRHILPTQDFKHLNCELFITGSDVRENHGFIFGPKNYFASMDRVSFTSKVGIPEAVACSTALPVIFEPIKIEDHNHFWEVMDGDIFFACPLEVAVASGADLVLVSHIYQPFEASYHPSEVVKMDEIALLSLYSLIHNHLNQRLHLLEKSSGPPIIIIQPDSRDLTFFKVGHFNFKEENVSYAMRVGYNSAIKVIPEILETLKKLNRDRPQINSARQRL